jgi:hypothetical protein
VSERVNEIKKVATYGFSIAEMNSLWLSVYLFDDKDNAAAAAAYDDDDDDDDDVVVVVVVVVVIIIIIIIIIYITLKQNRIAAFE